MSLSRQSLKWDPKSVEIRTKSVEKTLEPLIHQVTTLVNHYSRQHRKGYCKKKAHQLVRDIENATKLLVEVGKSIAEDFPEMKEPMLEACNEAKDAGDTMHKASNEFANDPCNPQKRNSMVRAARALLSSVTRLLCVADMADVQKLLQRIHTVDEHLKSLVNIGDINELITSFKDYGNDLIDLARQSGQRQTDLKNQRYKDELASARMTLKSSSRLLYTASKAYIRHPDVDSALENRDYAINELDDALTTIGEIAQAYGDGTQHPFEKGGSLALLFEDLLALIDHDPEEFYQKTLQRDVHTLVEEIIEGCSHIAKNVACTDSMKEKIYAECRNMKNALNTLLDSCVDPYKENITEIESAQMSMQRRTIDISKLVQNCVISSIADSFLSTNVPLVLLMEAAEDGNVKEVNESAATFLDHTAKLVEVADLACCICGNPEGIKMVKLSIQQIGPISQQVANSATTAAKHPQSKPARENMHMFRDTWLQQMSVLTEAVDDITTIDDYLIVSEQRVLEDTNHCVGAMQNEDISEMNRSADLLRERIWRVDDIVTSEIKNHESGEYTENVEKCLEKMKKQDLTYFLDLVEKVNEKSTVNEDDFEESARVVYYSFKNLRKSVRICIRVDESEHESDSTDQTFEFEEKSIDAASSVENVICDKSYSISKFDDRYQEHFEGDAKVMTGHISDEDGITSDTNYFGDDDLKLDSGHSDIESKDVNHFEKGETTYTEEEEKQVIQQIVTEQNEDVKWMKGEKTPQLLQLMTNEQKVKINTLAEGLEGDKDQVLSEVGKWKEQGNEIIVTVKRMCIIMMDLSNFTKGTGNLKTSMDVIKAAEKIAKYGSKLTELVGKLAQNCPDSHTKSDLLAYIQRIALYSHQLTVTARVKADVQMIGGEPIIVGVETVKSLIETARNLMNSVMLTVRASYVASTKHRVEPVPASSAWHLRTHKVVIDHSDYSSCTSSPSGYESDPRFFN